MKKFFRHSAVPLVVVAVIWWVSALSASQTLKAQNASRTPTAGASGHAPTVAAVRFPADQIASQHPVERAIAESQILDERTEQLAPGRIKRIRLARINAQPALVRVEEEWSANPNNQTWNCLRRDMFLADQMIVKVRAGVSIAALEGLTRQHGMRVRKMIAPNTFIVRLPDSSLDALPQAQHVFARRRDLLEDFEPDGVGFGGSTPNDPFFTEQWGVNNTGQNGGTVDADVDGPEFWDVITTAPGIVIAVQDTGLNFTHPDLQGIAWVNPAETAGDGIDNDGNGLIDDVNGWDFTNSDNNPTDDHGHGSNVTGIIAADRNNNTGVTGMLSGVRIMVCKVVNSSGSGLTSHLISGVTYARQHNVPIMNLSLQSYPFSSILNTEVTACQNAGILLCICAGNQGVDNDTTPNYPSCYPQTNIIAVGNHDRTDTRWAGSNPSNYGATTVDLFAPGREILSPVLGTGYSYFTGTSQATPFVTAVAAAIKSLNPTWSATQIKSSILTSVDARAAYNGICVTGGRLNALTSVASAVRQMPTADQDADGFSNFFEYLAGTQMDNSSSRPVYSCSVDTGYFRLKLPRIPRPDGHFQVEKSLDLKANDWTTVGVTDFSTPNLLDAGIQFSGPKGFLRIEAVMNP